MMGLWSGVGNSGPRRICSVAALTHDGVVVWSEGLWAAHCRLDARPLQLRQSVDGALDVAHEHVPVELEQTERKLLVDLAMTKVG